MKKLCLKSSLLALLVVATNLHAQTSTFDVVANWEAPTQNTDGGTISDADIVGYQLNWYKTSDPATMSTINVGKVLTFTYAFPKEQVCVTLTTIGTASNSDPSAPVCITPTSIKPNPPGVLTLLQLVSTPPPPPSGTAVHWHPGQYIWYSAIKGVDTGAVTSLTTWLSSSGVCTNANIRGIKLNINWNALESDTPGDYNAGFSGVDSILAALDGCGHKKLILQVKERDYGSAIAEPSASSFGMYPAYLLSGAYGTCCSGTNWGGVLSPPAGTTWSGGLRMAARLWDAVVMDRMIALFQAYGARYNEDKRMEMLGINETANGIPSGYGYSASNWYTQYKRLYAAMAVASPKIMARMVLNYTTNDGTMKDLIDYCKSLPNCVAGGPDPEMPLPEASITRTVAANQIFRGARCNGCDVHDYRGEVGWVGEQQAAGYIVGGAYPSSSTADIYAYQKNVMHNSFMVWVYYVRLSETLAQIAADASVHSVTCPPNFPACDTAN